LPAELRQLKGILDIATEQDNPPQIIVANQRFGSVIHMRAGYASHDELADSGIQLREIESGVHVAGPSCFVSFPNPDKRKR
jgi:hypothetical protein